MGVSPHPDDAEFGVAGTVARWVKEGKRVIFVICTNGDKGTFDQTGRSNASGWADT
jgi:LmbE family N-acetylglucosaminyl deacetylase